MGIKFKQATAAVITSNIAAGTITKDDIIKDVDSDRVYTLSKNKDLLPLNNSTVVSSTAPTSPMSGDVWIDDTDPTIPKMFYRKNNAWVEYGRKSSTNSPKAMIIRDADGCASISAPSSDGQIANKKYVDGTKRYKSIVPVEIEVGDWELLDGNGLIASHLDARIVPGSMGVHVEWDYTAFSAMESHVVPKSIETGKITFFTLNFPADTLKGTLWIVPERVVLV